jgi:hypothetical protein
VAKQVAIVQSSYIPWKGYFDLIASVDEFVLYDDAQFTKRDWRNRNQIKTADGLQWLTIPVAVKGRFTQAVKDATICERRWNERHWQSIRRSYARAPFFCRYEAALEDLFLGATVDRLSAVNHRLLSGFCHLLGITTPLRWSMEFQLEGDSTGRLVAICQQLGARTYLSGPAARAYVDERQFADAGISVTYADYSRYPEYAQLYPPFEHGVSIVDLLLHTGPDARRFMSSIRG